ncbi:MAG: alpha-amylase [Paludibacter sp.]|jgi:glycosidase|nr:alpha-amylase [Paludibacter sp.]
MKNNFLFLMVVGMFACGAVSCNKGQTHRMEYQLVEHEDWTRNAVIYEVNVRQYTKEGTFKAFEQQLPQLKDLGVDILWLMPVYPISELNKKGTLGSYYAVKDYKAVSPEFGTTEDFKSLIAKAHELGFKVILDWVANHTGCDNVWIASHKDWYVTDSTGGLQSPYDWTDAYKLNYKNAEMRAAMTDAMAFWLTDFDVDGFRCDVASEVPTDFWDSTRAVLNTVKPVFMLAEAETDELLDYAFDMDYGWRLLHLMDDVAKGEKTADSIAAYVQKATSPKDAYKMNFITNHDENSWNGTEYERLGAGVQTFAVLTYTLPGMPLIYSGQEIGNKKRFEFFEKDPVTSWNKNATFAFYKKLNELKHTQPALKAGTHGGEMKFYRHSAEKNVLFFSRTKEGKELVVMLNLSNEPQTIYSNAVLPKGGFTDFFSGKKTETLPTKLAAWEYRVFVH